MFFYRYITPYFNKLSFKEAYADKSLHSIWFPKENRPNTIVKNINGQHYDDDFNPLSTKDAIENCLGKKLIIKANDRQWRRTWYILFRRNG